MTVRQPPAQNCPPEHASPMPHGVMRVICLVLSVITGASYTGHVTTAQAEPPAVHWVRTIEMDGRALADPVGLAYSPHADAFYLVEQGASAGDPAATRISIVTAYGERLGSLTLALPPSPAPHLTYDSRWRRLLLWDAGRHALISVAARGDGTLDPATLTHFRAAHWGAQRVQGMAFDTAHDQLYLLDAVGPRLLRVAPADDGNWAGATVTSLAVPLTQPQGVVYDPASGHLHVRAAKTLYELALDGDVLAQRDLAEMALDEVGGLAFAPSADRTDAPHQHHLYVAGRAYAGNFVGGAHLMEFSLAETEPPRAQAAAPNSVQSVDLIQTIDASQWSPSSPDPSGIVYLPDANVLVVSDGEVDETVTITQSGQALDVTLYAGVNIWHVTTTGHVVDTWNTLAFSDEPTGITLNPANQHLFISDDTGTRGVYELDPGPDGSYDSDDDIVTFFDTSHFNAMDPEGVAYAADLDQLFIIDGANREVYRLSPGPNGIFDGAPPSGDDHVTHFDTLIAGLDDPKGIAYNPANGHLYAVGKPPTTLFEFTTIGTLVQTMDITHLNARGLDDLTFAAGSQNPAAMNIYIVARGIDNNLLPDRIPNDGSLYEISLGPAIIVDTPISIYLPLITR